MTRRPYEQQQRDPREFFAAVFNPNSRKAQQVKAQLVRDALEAMAEEASGNVTPPTDDQLIELAGRCEGLAELGAESGEDMLTDDDGRLIAQLCNELAMHRLDAADRARRAALPDPGAAALPRVTEIIEHAAQQCDNIGARGWATAVREWWRVLQLRPPGREPLHLLHPSQGPHGCPACIAFAEAEGTGYHPDSDVTPWDGACPGCGHIGGHVAHCTVRADEVAALRQQEEEEARRHISSNVLQHFTAPTFCPLPYPTGTCGCGAGHDVVTDVHDAGVTAKHCAACAQVARETVQAGRAGDGLRGAVLGGSGEYPCEVVCPRCQHLHRASKCPRELQGRATGRETP